MLPVGTRPATYLLGPAPCLVEFATHGNDCLLSGVPLLSPPPRCVSCPASLPQPPTGYKSSSSRPQAATGGLVRYLCDHDIKEDLVGRHAELFWPDDNLWYLIEIQVRGSGQGGGTK